MKNSNLGLLALLIFTSSGCSLLFGNIKPTEEKSKNYGILDLSLSFSPSPTPSLAQPSQGHSEWVKLDQKMSTEREETQGLASELSGSGISDVAYQSKETASIISLNSACKTYALQAMDKKETLESLTQELLLGISEITLKEERNLTIDQIPALETTTKGKIRQENMMLRTVVLKRLNCVYDLMYVARPESFDKNRDDFSRFVSSLKLR